MSLKRILFITLLALSLLVFSIHASPIRRAEVGKKVSITLDKLGGTITFEQTSAENVTVSGQITKGLTVDDPTVYAIAIGYLYKTFEQLGIVIDLPGTKPFSGTAPGNVDVLVDQELDIIQILDGGKLA
ncbi:7959_t:CDS:1 [Acaulospora morrowiae]|uniref:7959_t:CDS:1 n=1 Tax=Acaulospora morrowiae TaxID=94023 RepID=A0A9N8ZMK2_9GLOM|nr:7959_t:CDS:1 [Acaulospora morrowiae]